MNARTAPHWQDDRIRGRVGRWVPLVVFFVWMLAGAVVAVAADKVEDLARLLRQDTNYKVRVQAALVLGRLGDRNAVSALTAALDDANNMVRAVAAQALGKLGAPEAVGDLQKALKSEKNNFARSQMQAALNILGRSEAEPGEGGGRIYLTLGPFSGGSRSASEDDLGFLRAALKRTLGVLGNVTFALTPAEEKTFVGSGRLGFMIDGNVTRLDDAVVGGTTEVNCDVKVQVFKWPSRSLISWTSAGAAVQSGARPREKEIARRDCLEATAGQLGDDLKRFFQSQGG